MAFSSVRVESSCSTNYVSVPLVSQQAGEKRLRTHSYTGHFIPITNFSIYLEMRTRHNYILHSGATWLSKGSVYMFLCFLTRNSEQLAMPPTERYNWKNVTKKILCINFAEFLLLTEYI